jgi:hypothetical protein
MPSLYKEKFLIFITISLVAQILLGLTKYCFETSFYKNLLGDEQIYITIASFIFVALIHLWINGAIVSSIIESSRDSQEVGIMGFFLIAKSRLPSLLWISFLFIFINISLSAIIGSVLIVIILFSEEWINPIYIIFLALLNKYSFLNSTYLTMPKYFSIFRIKLFCIRWEMHSFRRSGKNLKSILGHPNSMFELG